MPGQSENFRPSPLRIPKVKSIESFERGPMHQDGKPVLQKKKELLHAIYVARTSGHAGKVESPLLVPLDFHSMDIGGTAPTGSACAYAKGVRSGQSQGALAEKAGSWGPQRARMQSTSRMRPSNPSTPMTPLDLELTIDFGTTKSGGFESLWDNGHQSKLRRQSTDELSSLETCSPASIPDTIAPCSSSPASSVFQSPQSSPRISTISMLSLLYNGFEPCPANTPAMGPASTTATALAAAIAVVVIQMQRTPQIDAKPKAARDTHGAGCQNSMHSSSVFPRQAELSPRSRSISPLMKRLALPTHTCGSGIQRDSMSPRSARLSGRSSGRSPSTERDIDLLLPWKEGTLLTKANSYFLQTGLHFDIAEEATSKVPDPPTVSSPVLAWAAIQAFTEDRTVHSEHHQVALCRELQRQQELETRIQQREQRREVARQRGEQTRQREVEGLRAAMWLLVCSLTTRDMWNAPRRAKQFLLLMHLILPRWRLLVYRRKEMVRRAKLIQQTAVRHPTPQQLKQSGPLFNGWGEELLTSFIGQLQLKVFDAGEYICHQGDPSDVMYLLAEGEVDVVVRNPDSLSKARGKKTGQTVATFQPVKYFGEYGVFADEPRSATLYCSTRTVAWTCGQENLVQHLKRLPSSARRQIDVSFEANMSKIYRVQACQLNATHLFHGLPLDAVRDLIKKLEPVCVPQQTTIIEANTAASCMYFISKGRCVASCDGRERSLGAGDIFGERGCMFLEPHPETVRAIKTAQVWRLPKAMLMDFMLTMPKEFLDAKRRLNEAWAAHLPKPFLSQFSAGSISNAIPMPVLEKLYYSNLHPLVVEPGGIIFPGRSPISQLILITNGCCTNGESIYAAGSWLGLDQIESGLSFWDAAIVAKDLRVEAWSIGLEDIIRVWSPDAKLRPRKFLKQINQLLTTHLRRSI